MPWMRGPLPRIQLQRVGETSRAGEAEQTRPRLAPHPSIYTATRSNMSRPTPHTGHT